MRKNIDQPAGIQIVALTDIGKWLRTMRKAKGYSLQVLAEKMGVQHNTIMHHEKGKGLSLEKLAEYEKVLGVQIMVAIAIGDEDMKRLLALKQQ